jgi:hypothetical protein
LDDDEEDELLESEDREDDDKLESEEKDDKLDGED